MMERATKKIRMVEDGGQFIGIFTIEDAPNEFIRALCAEAAKHGVARRKDADGCCESSQIWGLTVGYSHERIKRKLERFMPRQDNRCCGNCLHFWPVVSDTILGVSSGPCKQNGVDSNNPLSVDCIDFCIYHEIK